VSIGDSLRDIRLAIRQIKKRPGFALGSVLILTLGIGATTAVFSIVSAVLLRPLPFENPDRLVVVWESNLEEGQARSRISPPTFLEWREQQESLAGITAISEGSHVEGGSALADGSEPRRLNSAAVSANFFSILGVRVEIGRSFLPEDDRVGAARTVILGHAVWRQRYGADPSVVGRTLTLDNEPYEVIGVAPQGFDYPSETEVWTTLLPQIPGALDIRGARFLSGLGRLLPDVSLAQAETDLSTISGRQVEGWGARLVPLHEHIAGDVRPAFLILLAAVVFVLLIACANVANLLLARSTGRYGELAIRTALGASRLRIMGHLIWEALVLAIAGGVLGLLLAAWGLDLLIAMSPQDLPRSDEIGINGTVLVFAFVVSLLTGLVSGIAPSFRSSKPELTSAFNEAGRAVTGGIGRNRLRSGLVVMEVAVSLVLLIGAGLMVKSFMTILRIDPGFQPASVMTFDLALPSYRYPEPQHQAAFFEALLERVEALPGVRTAALTRNLPLSGRSMRSPVRLEGESPPESGGQLRTQVATVSPQYFRAMGIQVTQGRAFTDRDGPDGAPVAIVNESFARQAFPGQDAIGKNARTFFGQPVMREIVGVVSDVRHSALTADAPPTFYTPLAQGASPFFTLVVRAEEPQAAALAAVRTAIRDADPDLPIDAVASLDELLSRSTAEPRFYATMLGAFAGMALLLAIVGLYAVMANSVAQRRREIGIRMAVGAQVGNVVRLVVSQGLVLTTIGLAVGLAAAFGVTRVLAKLLFGVSATDAGIFAVSALLLGAVALLATYIPARSATRVDPLLVLRD
jgi:putative ABC transport system permease protein